MAAKKKTQSSHIDHGDHTHEPILKLDDGTVEIIFNVEWNVIERSRRETALEMGKNVTVPGFRQGKAPVERLMTHLPADQLLERSLGKILPILLGQEIQKHNVRPAIYPKFELLHAHEGQDWTVKATTCELPEIELGDYKKAVVEETKKLKSDATVDEKQDAAIKGLASTLKFSPPRLLVEEEANGRLGNLLTRLEKLGLSLESYLSSQKKSAPELRAEYEGQAAETIKVELALMKITEIEKLAVSDADIDSFISVAQLKVEAGREAEQKNLVRSILTKRKAIEYLANLN